MTANNNSHKTRMTSTARVELARTTSLSPLCRGWGVSHFPYSSVVQKRRGKSTARLPTPTTWAKPEDKAIRKDTIPSQLSFPGPSLLFAASAPLVACVSSTWAAETKARKLYTTAPLSLLGLRRNTRRGTTGTKSNEAGGKRKNALLSMSVSIYTYGDRPAG